jgi:hypothetical protein
LTGYGRISYIYSLQDSLCQAMALIEHTREEAVPHFSPRPVEKARERGNRSIVNYKEAVP